MISPTTEALEDAVRACVADGSGWSGERGRVIPGDDGKPAPRGAYATAVLVVSDRDGLPWTRAGAEAHGAIPATVYEPVNEWWSVQWFRRGAIDLARTFRNWMSSPGGRRAFERRGLTLYGARPLPRLTDVVSAAFEERAGLDLHLGYVATQVFDRDEAVIDGAEIIVDHGAPGLSPVTVTVGDVR